MIYIENETMKLVIDALEYPINTSSNMFDADVAELKTHRALAELRQLTEKPPSDYRAMYLKIRDELAALQQRKWSGLTDKEANALWESTDSDWELMKRTEAKLREKNT